MILRFQKYPKIGNVHIESYASQGEGGKVDITARFESRRNRSFVYFQPPNAGLIELDERINYCNMMMML